MKAQINDEIKTLTDIASTWDHRIFPKGITGVIDIRAKLIHTLILMH